MNLDFDAHLFSKVFGGYAPSSREYSFQEDMKKIFTKQGFDVAIDACGNLFTLPVHTERPIVLIMAHADQVALQVKEITQEGFLKFRKIGGIDIHSFYGQEVRVIHDGHTVAGIIGRNPRNINESEAGFTINTKSLWIDIGAKSREEAERYVGINDMVVFAPNQGDLLNDIVASPACDDRVGVYCCLKIAETFTMARKDLPFELCFALSAQEEIGCRGSKSLALRYKPMAAIILDAEYADDFPGGNDRISVGSGPVITDNADNNPYLVELARTVECEHQYAFTSEFFGCSDAESFITNSPDTSVIGVGIPVRNMHSAREVMSKRDLISTIEFCSQFIRKLAYAYEEGNLFQRDRK